MTNALTSSALTVGAFSSFVLVGELLLRVGNAASPFTLVERLVIASALGTAAVAAELFGLAVIGIAWRPWTLAGPWIALGGYLLASAARSRRAGTPATPSQVRSRNPPPPAWLRAALGIVIVLGATLLWRSALTNPFPAPDARAFWTPKAKIFFVHRNDPAEAFRDLPLFFHPDYPLLVPLMETWVFLWQGEPDEYLMKLVFPLLTTLLCAAVFAFTCRIAGDGAGWIAAALFITTPAVLRHGSVAYADMPLALFFWIATALIVAWLRTPERSLVLLAGVFAGFSAWLKNEGIPLCLLLGLSVTFCVARSGWSRERFRDLVIFWAASAITAAVWLSVRQTLRSSSLLKVPGIDEWASILATRAPVIFHDAAVDLFGFEGVVSKWNVVWYLLIFAAAIRRRTMDSGVRVVLMIIAGYATLILSISMITPIDIQWYFAESFDRLLLQMYPLVTFAMAALVTDRGIPYR